MMQDATYVGTSRDFLKFLSVPFRERYKFTNWEAQFG
jgi:hypothetical protein